MSNQNQQMVEYPYVVSLVASLSTFFTCSSLLAIIFKLAWGEFPNSPLDAFFSVVSLFMALTIWGQLEPIRRKSPETAQNERTDA